MSWMMAMYSSSIFWRSSAARRRELHLEDGVGLDLGEAEALHQVAAGGLDVGRLADGADDRVEVVERDLEALEDVGPVPGLPQVELGPPSHDLAAATRCGAASICLSESVCGWPSTRATHVGVEGHLAARCA